MIESLEKKAAEATEAEKKYAEAKRESEDRARRAEEAEAKVEQMQEAFNRWDRALTYPLLCKLVVCLPNRLNSVEKEINGYVV